MLHWSGIMSYCLCEIVIHIHHFKDSIRFLHDLFQTGHKQKNVTGLCERAREVVSVWNPFHVVVKTLITSCLGTNAPIMGESIDKGLHVAVCISGKQVFLRKTKKFWWSDISGKTWTVGEILSRPISFMLYDTGYSLVILKEPVNRKLSLSYGSQSQGSVIRCTGNEWCIEGGQNSFSGVFTPLYSPIHHHKLGILAVTGRA